MNRKNINLGFSAMVDMNVYDEAIYFTHELGLFLSKNLNISEYGNKLKEICLIFMAMDPTTHSFRPDRKFWRWKAGNFDMYVNVPDYEKYCQIREEKEAQKIIAELYLASIKKYLWKRKDFDAPKFYKDVKEVLKPILNY